MAKKKLIIIGIDGGTFDIINPLINEGKLKNLAEFEHKAILKSTIPPGTAVSWASFLTGVNPGKTNVYDFTIIDDNSWKFKFVNGGILGEKPFYKYLSEAGLKCCVLNIPMTYPPEKINGVIVSGIDAPSTLSNYTYPAEVKEILKKFNYKIEVSGLKEKKDLPSEAVDLIKIKTRVAKYFLEKDFDFYVVLFRESDVAQHFAWGTDKMKEVYVRIDNFIGEAKNFAEKSGAEIIVMSDHGHERLKQAFNVNVWLENEGYLKAIAKKSAGTVGKFGINRERIFKILEKLGLQFLVKLVPRALAKKIPTKNVELEEAILTNLIDMTKSRAMAKRAVKTSQIYFNTKLRGGIVSKEEEKILEKEIKEKLESYFKSKNLNAEIKTKEELYGKNAKYAPNITFYFREKGFDVLASFLKEKNLWDNPREPATHNQEGVILTDMNLNLKKPRIIDFAPTILDYFGILKKVKGKKFEGKSLV